MPELRLSADLESGDFIHRILETDSLVYREELRGSLESLATRFHANRDSYLLAVESGLIVGYFCFFPVANGLWREMEAGVFHDDDIGPDQILSYGERNNLFIISAAIHPDWRDGEAIRILMQGFVDFLRGKEKLGKRIDRIGCFAVSKDGEKLAGRLGMGRIGDSSFFMRKTN